MRASDEDRQRAAEILRRATGQGYLSLSEFEERIDAALRATYLSDLDPLFVDIPGSPRPSLAWSPQPAPTPPPVPHPMVGPMVGPQWWSPPANVVLRVALVVVLIALAVSLVTELAFPVPIIAIAFFCWRRGHRYRGWRRLFPTELI
jgi:hypothetical protein